MVHLHDCKIHLNHLWYWKYTQNLCQDSASSLCNDLCYDWDIWLLVYKLLAADLHKIDISNNIRMEKWVWIGNMHGNTQTCVCVCVYIVRLSSALNCCVIFVFRKLFLHIKPYLVCFLFSIHSQSCRSVFSQQVSSFLGSICFPVDQCVVQKCFFYLRQWRLSD